MEDIDCSTFLKAKKTIPTITILKYFGFIHNQDFRKIVADILRCESPQVPSRITLTAGRAAGILAGIQEWQKNQEEEITNNYQGLVQNIIAVESQNIPLGYISFKSARDRYGSNLTTDFYGLRAGTQKTFRGEIYLFEPALKEYRDKISIRIQSNLQTPRKRKAVGVEDYIKMHSKYLDL